MSFEQLNLNSHISKALSVCGYTAPTVIQSRSIPEILNGKDLVASAQTGTGKTAAFVLPALNRLSLSKSKGKPRILILTPTRELATQITDAIGRYSRYLQVSSVTLLGGMPYHKQLKALSRPLDIIVATPGRLMDHMERGRVSLSDIEMLILDEADRMLDMGFIDDVTYIAKKTPSTRQTLLFSATVDNKLAQVVRNLLTDPVRIDLSNEKITPTQIKQELYYADSPHHKMRLLQHMLENENMFKAIIFTSTKVHCDQLAADLTEQEYPAAPLHGDLKQNQRNKTVDRLRRGKIQFLVATDVAARGIDISDVTHVINFDLPKFSEDYVHRIGRTGRAGKTGIAISFALPSDARHVQRIERFIGQKFVPSVIAGLEPTKRPKSFSGSSNSNPQRKRSQGYSSGRSNDFGRKKAGSDSPFDRSFKKKPRSEESSDRGGFKAKSRFDDSSDRPFKKKPRSEESSDRGGFKSKSRFEGSSDRGSFKPKSRFEDSSDRPFKKKPRSDESSDRGGFKPKSRFEGSSDRGGFKPKSKFEGSSDRGGFKPKSRFEDSSDRGSFKPKSRFDDSADRPFKKKPRSEESSDRGGFKPKSRFEGSSDRGGFKPKSRFEDSADRPFKKKPRSEESSDRGFKKKADGDKPASFGRKKSSDKASDFTKKPRSFKKTDRN